MAQHSVYICDWCKNEERTERFCPRTMQPATWSYYVGTLCTERKALLCRDCMNLLGTAIVEARKRAQ